MKLYIVGFSGAGKSTLAKALAQSWSIAYVDTDELCAQRCGKSIAEFVLQNGWPAFRELESEVLFETQKKNYPSEFSDYSTVISPGKTDQYQAIVACGGGIVESPRNRDLLKPQRIVWLNPPWSLLWSRIRQTPSAFCKGKNEVELYQDFRERCKLYRQILN
jgi:shikimate kinase